jgi:molybdopterin converting factor small subunit
MKVKVRVFGYLRNYISSNTKEIEVEIDQQSDLLDLFEFLGIPEKELEFNILLINGRNFPKHKKLSEGDIVSIIPLADGV